VGVQLGLGRGGSVCGLGEGGEGGQRSSAGLRGGGNRGWREGFLATGETEGELEGAGVTTGGS
jgi:hypothetical protein